MCSSTGTFTGTQTSYQSSTHTPPHLPKPVTLPGPFQRTARRLLTTLGPHVNASGVNPGWPSNSRLWTLHRPQIPVLLWAADCPACPRELIPLCLDTAQITSSHVGPPTRVYWSDLTRDLPVFLSLIICCAAGREECSMFQSKQTTLSKGWLVKNYVKMIIQVITPAARIKAQINWKVYYFPEIAFLNNGCKDRIWGNMLSILN